MNSLVVSKITGNLPAKTIIEYTLPDNIILADPSYNVPRRIDILIGAGHFFDIIAPRQYKVINNVPVYQDTKFGFVVSGEIQKSRDNVKSKSYHSVNTVNELLTNIDNNDITILNDTSIEKLLQRFWEIEENVSATAYTSEEKACCDFFEKTVRREIDGRFVVELPFRENIKNLGKSYEIAKHRLFAMERRFKRNPDLKAGYVKFMREYEELNHMTYISSEQSDIPGQMCYLAHHCVQNINSNTTRLRVVFDASTKTESGLSLNDVLLKGPGIQDELIYILTRFRMHNFVITADIKKMYRQINIIEKQRDFQRILWRENENSPIKIYKLNTITYGTVPAS